MSTLLFINALLLDVHAQSLEVRIHDPVMIKQDNTYYLFGTGAGVRVYSSTNLKQWQRLPPIFESTPEWVYDIVPDFRKSMWAPDITFHDGTYYLYYSVSSFGKNTSAIGVATNKTLNPDDPDFKWTDRRPVIESVPGRDMWNAIDPNLAFDDEGTPWLSFGSFWNGIKLFKLQDNLLSEASDSTREWYTIAARQRDWKLNERYAGNEDNGAIEAPFIFEKDEYYYLFVSWGRCCIGKESTYKVMVGRAKDVTGPYLDRSGESLIHGGGTLVVQGNQQYAGIGHNSVYTFDGTDYLIAHGYDLSDGGKSKLLILEVTWDSNGWPEVSLNT